MNNPNEGFIHEDREQKKQKILQAINQILNDVIPQRDIEGFLNGIKRQLDQEDIDSLNKFGLYRSEMSDLSVLLNELFDLFGAHEAETSLADLLEQAKISKDLYNEIYGFIKNKGNPIKARKANLN